MWAEVLRGEDRNPFFETFRRIDSEMFEVYAEEFLVMYFDKNFTGKNVISIIAENVWTELVDLDGVNAAILYTWNGAYKTKFLMLNYSSYVTLFTYPEYYRDKPIQRKESKNAFAFSVRSLMTAVY
jgi:hypothetical protein